MPNEFDISPLFRAAFGIGRGRAIDFVTQRNQPFDKDQIQEPELLLAPPYEEQPQVDTSEGEFGTMRDILGSNLPDGRPVFMPVKIGDLLLPNEPTISIVRKKIIKSTTLTGSKRKGTVKEMIGYDDDILVIRGIAINNKNTKVYPEKMVKDIDDLAKLPQALDIQCALTSLLGIYRVVITKVRYPEMTGVQHAQAYEFQCISDEDFILEI